MSTQEHLVTIELSYLELGQIMGFDWVEKYSNILDDRKAAREHLTGEPYVEGLRYKLIFYRESGEVKALAMTARDVPDEKWGAYTMAAKHISAEKVLA